MMLAKVRFGLCVYYTKNPEQRRAQQLVQYKLFVTLHPNFSGYVAWGLLISLQPPFYPSEAEKKGENSFFYQCLNFLFYVSSN